MSTSSSQIRQQKIERLHTPHFHVTSIDRRGLRDLYITIAPEAGEHFSSLLERLQSVLKENEATIVQQQIFAATDQREQHLRLIKLFFGAIKWPITWVEGAPCNGAAIAGMHVHAVSGARIETVKVDGTVLGCTFDDGLARHLFLGGLMPHDTFCSEASQARQVYDQLEAALLQAGLNLSNVIRTWFFLDRILEWYGDFNKVRNFIYGKNKSRFFPASTGVGVKNESNTALILDDWAEQPLEGHMKIC